MLMVARPGEPDSGPCGGVAVTASACKGCCLIPNSLSVSLLLLIVALYPPESQQAITTAASSVPSRREIPNMTKLQLVEF